MTLEVAILNIKNELSIKFEENVASVSKIITSIIGYNSHDLMKCLEYDDKHLINANWEIVEDHEIGFRKFEEYLEWKRLLNQYYEPFPATELYK